MVTVPPETVAGPLVTERLTGKPELDVEMTEKGASPKTWGGTGAKTIVCGTMPACARRPPKMVNIANRIRARFFMGYMGQSGAGRSGARCFRQARRTRPPKIHRFYSAP